MSKPAAEAHEETNDLSEKRMWCCENIQGIGGRGYPNLGRGEGGTTDIRDLQTGVKRSVSPFLSSTLFRNRFSVTYCPAKCECQQKLFSQMRMKWSHFV